MTGLTSKPIKLPPFTEREVDYPLGSPIFKKQQILPNRGGKKPEVPRVTLATSSYFAFVFYLQTYDRANLISAAPHQLPFHHPSVNR